MKAHVDACAAAATIRDGGHRRGMLGLSISGTIGQAVRHRLFTKTTAIS